MDKDSAIGIRQSGLSFHHGMWVGAIATLLVAAALVITAHADWYGTVGIGEGRYFESAPDNPAWQQIGFDHVTNAVTPVWRLGAGYQFRPWLRGEAAYDDLGRFNKFGAWGFADDGNPLPGGTRYVYSTARTRAIDFTALIGDPLYLRAGAAWWHSTCDVYFSNPGPDNRSFNHLSCDDVTGWTPVFGLGARHGDWSLELVRYSVIKPHYIGSTQGANSITVGWRF